MTQLESRKLGTVLLLTRDATAARKLTEVFDTHALGIETAVAVSTALDRLARRKFEAVIVDFAIGAEAARVVEQVRQSASNRTAVTFALTSIDDAAQALKSVTLCSKSP